MVTQAATKSNWQKVRKLFNDIHLWSGLTSGIVVIAICFSGTIYVYNTEITEMSAPHLYKVEAKPGVQRIPPDSLIASIEKNSEGKVQSLNYPADLSRTYQFNAKKKDDKSRGATYMVNPYNGNIVGNSAEKNGTKEFMSKMFSLHRWLMLDKIETPILKNKTNRELGSVITGWTTIIFTLGCITGLIIWFPQKLRNWRQGLKVKFNANWKRVNHDLHNTLAFYSLIFLLLMGLTGPQWSFEWYRNGLQKTLGTYKPKDKPGPEKKNEVKDVKPVSLDSIVQPVISLSSVIAIADKALPYAGDYNIQIPQEQGTPYTISKTKIGFFAPAAADRLIIDAYSGNLIRTEIFKNKPFKERVAGSIKAIHVGNVYGKFTKILYFLACLVATSLPVSGTMIWWNKLKQKRRKTNLVFKAQPEFVTV
ncbi:PepSY-associated TM helix domain-containing protein [Pollutibacter soli]|uniref:PepSY-associated TM helix domain-containing protein n=1 Tax=Pollutibacter soli TaxID=3034157 RepID=UPI00301414FA